MPTHLWEDNRITPIELAAVVVTVILATGASTMPAFTALLVKHDGWIAAGFGSVVGLIVLLIVWHFARRFPNDTFLDFSGKLVGSLGAKALACLYGIYFFHVASVVIRESTDFLIVAFYPTGSPFSLGGLLLALTTYMVWHGLEGIGRTALVVVPIQVFFTLTVTIAASGQLQPELILPLFERGVAPVLRAAMVPGSWFGELIVIAFFLTSVKGGRRRLIGAATGTAAIVVLITGISITGAMVFGDQVGHFAYPRTSVARFVTIGGFFRIDPLSMAIWLFLTAIKIAIFQYVTMICLARLFGLADHRPLAVPLAGMILLSGSASFANKQELDAWILSGGPVFAFLVQLVVPSILVLVSTVRSGVRSKGAGERPAMRGSRGGNRT